jgi:hypothetical protein
MNHIPARVKPSPQAARLMSQSARSDMYRATKGPQRSSFYMPRATHDRSQRASHERNQPRNSAPVAAEKRNPDEAAAKHPTPKTPAGSGLLHASSPKTRAINLILPGSGKEKLNAG